MTKKQPLTYGHLKKSLLEDSEEYKGVEGIFLYFLLRNGEVVYVGQTCNLGARIHQHKKDKIFDGMRYVRFHDPAELDASELAHIIFHNPEYNSAIPEVGRSGYTSVQPFRMCFEPRPSARDIQEVLCTPLVADRIMFRGKIYFNKAEMINAYQEYYGKILEPKNDWR